MVEEKESWPCPQQSAWQRVNQNFMIEPGQGESLPAWTNSGTRPLSADMVFPSVGTEQTTEAHGLLRCVPPHFPSFLPPYFREKQFVFSGTGLLNAIPRSSSEKKKLLVFDQCGTQTRLLYSSACCSPVTAPTTKVTCHYKDEHEAAKVKSISHAERFGCGYESELHEDTEELNALLYSDDDECSDEEERSTGHSPMPNIECFEEIAEEVSSFTFPKKRHEGSAEVSDPNKRQKFHHLMDTASSIKQVESQNYADAVRETRRGSVSDDEQVKRERIRETLRVLESIVPGVKGKEPLLVLDKAIEYFKCIKFKATTLLLD